jgi:hypothetical protein
MTLFSATPNSAWQWWRVTSLDFLTASEKVEAERKDFCSPPKDKSISSFALHSNKFWLTDKSIKIICSTLKLFSVFLLSELAHPKNALVTPPPNPKKPETIVKCDIWAHERLQPFAQLYNYDFTSTILQVQFYKYNFTCTIM